MMTRIHMPPRLSRRKVNGHNSTREFTLTDIEGDGISAGSANREATRYLSAATQIDIGYAKNVVERVMEERFRALAPTFGVDVPVVVKWAIKALHTQARRDCLLVIALFLLLMTLPLLFISIWFSILVPLILIFAWLIVSREYWGRIHNIVRGKMLKDRFDPRQAPRPPLAADRERLREVANRRDGNFVVFSGHSAFIGSGNPVYRQRLLLDVSRRKDEEETKKDDVAKKKELNGEDSVSGKTKKTEKPDRAEGSTLGESKDFSSQDLHTAIVKAFDNESGLGKSLGNIKVYERLFVNGLHIQYDRDLLPNPFQPPPTSVREELLAQATVHPSPEARTYVCVEMPGWHGQLVVTLFIRAVYAGGSLFVEWTFRVLPPLHAKFLGIDRFYELPRNRQIADSLRSGLRDVIPALLKSPIEAIRWQRRPSITQRNQSRQSYAIKRGKVSDYGAKRSIREDACGRQRSHYFLARDEAMYVLLAQQTLIRAVENFLDEHGVDLGTFHDQVKVIFDNSINIGDIKDSKGVVIGDNSSATVNDSSKGTK